jgi:acyl-CoA synthetase (AMP-forming)/AMP-acid ligase II
MFILSHIFAQECGVSGQKYTYAQAKDACHYISRSLYNIGLKKGDVIALVGPNYPDTILGLLGSIMGGFVVTTMNPQYMAGKLFYISQIHYICLFNIFFNNRATIQVSERIGTKRSVYVTERINEKSSLIIL